MKIEGLPHHRHRAAAGLSNPRSTVATTTEIYDYLQGKPCSRRVAPLLGVRQADRAQSATQIVDSMGRRGRRSVPSKQQWAEGDAQEVLEAMTRQGFVRCRIDGKVMEIKGPLLDKIGYTRLRRWWTG